MTGPAQLDGVSIGLKVDVDTLRGTLEGVPRLVGLLRRHEIDATFYFSVGPDHTGRALRRVFRPGFARKVARTSVVRHYGVRTLLYGVLLPGPDIGRRGGAAMRAVHAAGFEVGLHTYDHVRWQDHVARATSDWTRAEFGRGIAAFERVFGFRPQSHAAAGWQLNAETLALEREYGLRYASDTRGHSPFLPRLAGAGHGAGAPCPQLPTTLPTFDELIGTGGIDERNVAAAVFDASVAPGRPPLQVFTLHAELEGNLLLDAFEQLLLRWRSAGARLTRMASIHDLASRSALPEEPVGMGTVPGRSGLLGVQGPGTAALA